MLIRRLFHLSASRFCTSPASSQLSSLLASGTPISPSRLESLIRVDQQHFSSCLLPILRTFRSLLSHHHFTTPQSLTHMLCLLSQYPRIPLPPSHIQYIYYRLGEDMHRLSSKQVFGALLFMGGCDDKYQESVLYEHVIRYYVKNKYEVIRTVFRVDFATSMLGAFRNLYDRVLTMRYSRRGPPFTMTLDIPVEYRSRLLMLLLKSPNTSSMLLKKLHFQMFRPIKHFYEHQMSENLYHQKNPILLEMILKDIQAWCTHNPLLDEENTLAVQLCCKLMLTLRQQGKGMPKCYRLSVLWRELNEKYDKKEQEIMEVMAYIQSIMLSEKYIEQCDTLQRISLLTNAREIIDPSLAKHLSTQLITHLHSSQVLFSFRSLYTLLSTSPTISSLFSQNIPLLCHHLPFTPLLTLCLQIYPSSPTALGKLMHQLCEIEDCTPTPENIRDLLKVISLEQSKDQPERRMIRNFVFKYLSDHHEGFRFGVYEECWGLVKGMGDAGEPFDQSGMYAKNVFEELANYNRKIGIS